MIITVTMNAALDRVLTVPNFKEGQRHRASEKLTLAGGKGITVARALKTLGVPVVATGLAGGRNGRRILEELAEESILSDFVGIEDESRTSTAVADPTSGTFTEVMEWGPLVQETELEELLEKIDYLSKGAELVIFAGTLPRGVADNFYAEAIRTLGRRGVFTVLDSEGEPLRIGLEAEPFLVSPNRIEAEAVVGQEFSEDDFLDALDRLGDLGARNALITYERGVSPQCGRARPGEALPCRRADGGGRVGRGLRRRAAGRLHRRLARGCEPGGCSAPGSRRGRGVDVVRGCGPVRPGGRRQAVVGRQRGRALARRRRLALLPFIRT